MNYQQALNYLYSLIDYERSKLRYNTANYDLRRMEELLALLGNPHLTARSVHIAGTNGKGSIAAMIASSLIASGYTTGLYTSPHLIEVRERIRVGEELISEEELTSLVTKLKPAVEAVNEKATYGRLTTFELLTALAFAYFEQKGVELQVLETGMGGRLDATNVVNAEVSIISSISFDHMQALGQTLSKIAEEKAGIIKPSSTVVTAPQPDEVDQIIEDTCLQQGVRLVRVGSDLTWQSLGVDFNRQRIRVKGILDSYELSIPLLGQHQSANAATAVAALEVIARLAFTIPRHAIIEGLAQVKWAGRCQILSRQPLIVADGAHNPDAAQKLKQSLEECFTFDHAILVIGLSSDKDISSIVSTLSPFFDRVIVTRSGHPRAMAPTPIAAEFSRHGREAEVIETTPEALSLALALAGDRDLICAAGSLFVVGEVIKEANRLNLAT